MGCDIHAVVEYERFPGATEADGTWSPAAVDCLRERNYYLFEAMAGVRGEERNAIAPPRGYPEPIMRTSIGYESVDAALGIAESRKTYTGTGADTKVSIDPGDHHTESWLTLEEFERAVTRSVELSGSRRPPSPDVLGVIALMRAYKDAGKRVRIIFNFDN